MYSIWYITYMYMLQAWLWFWMPNWCALLWGGLFLQLSTFLNYLLTFVQVWDHGILVHKDIYFPKYHLIKMLFFPPVLFLVLLNFKWLKCCVLQFESLILFYRPILVPVLYCSYYHSFELYPEIWKDNPSSIVLYAQDCFGHSGSFVVAYEI